MESSIAKSPTNWYILYTCPRAEKAAYRELTYRAYEAFLPVTKVLKVWKNRQKKVIEQVLFPSYIFVNTEEHELYKIKQVPKVATYLHIAGKPSVVSLNIIEGIKKMVSLDIDISVETDFNEGEEVKIIEGPLVGYSGILVKQRGKSRFGIQLSEINQTVFVDICTSVLERLN